MYRRKSFFGVINYNTQKWILRLSAGIAGLYTITPIRAAMSEIMEFPIIGFVDIAFIVGILTILFAYGSAKRWW